jgi:hypothetical protein
MFLIKPKSYSDEEIQLIIKGLESLYPDLTIRLLQSDKRFIRVSKIIGEQRVDTIPISITQWEDISIFEADKIFDIGSINGIDSIEYR